MSCYDYVADDIRLWEISQFGNGIPTYVLFENRNVKYICLHNHKVLFFTNATY